MKKIANVTQKDTWLFLVFIDNKKISEALRNGLRRNLFQIKTTPVINVGIRDAFLQLLAEFVCSLNTTINKPQASTKNRQTENIMPAATSMAGCIKMQQN